MIFWLIPAIAAALFVLYLFMVCPRLRHPGEGRTNVPFAHRGLYDAENPENSLAAFERAVQAGFGIEFDVQLSADGELMVFHDYDLYRMTGKNEKLCRLTCVQLQELSLGGTTQTIPTLEQLLTLVNDRVPLLIEIKGVDTHVEELCRKLAERMDRYDGTFCIESFNPLHLRWFKKNRPDIVRGQLVTNTLKTWKEGKGILRFMLTNQLGNVFSRPDFIAFDRTYPSNAALWFNFRLFHATPFVWTVQDAAEYQNWTTRGVYPIFEQFIPGEEKKDTSEG